MAITKMALLSLIMIARMSPCFWKIPRLGSVLGPSGFPEHGTSTRNHPEVDRIWIHIRNMSWFFQRQYSIYSRMAVGPYQDYAEVELRYLIV